VPQPFLVASSRSQFVKSTAQLCGFPLVKVATAVLATRPPIQCKSPVTAVVAAGGGVKQVVQMANAAGMSGTPAAVVAF
jgi:hypothetical protein